MSIEAMKQKLVAQLLLVDDAHLLKKVDAILNPEKNEVDLTNSQLAWWLHHTYSIITGCHVVLANHRRILLMQEKSEEYVLQFGFFQQLRELYLFVLVTQLHKLFADNSRSEKLSFRRLLKQLQGLRPDSDMLGRPDGGWKTLDEVVHTRATIAWVLSRCGDRARRVKNWRHTMTAHTDPDKRPSGDDVPDIATLKFLVCAAGVIYNAVLVGYDGARARFEMNHDPDLGDMIKMLVDRYPPPDGTYGSPSSA